MNIGVAKVFQVGEKTEKIINGGSCTAKTQYYFHKLKGRLVWREPHSAIPWLRHWLWLTLTSDRWIIYTAKHGTVV